MRALPVACRSMNSYGRNSFEYLSIAASGSVAWRVALLVAAQPIDILADGSVR